MKKNYNILLRKLEYNSKYRGCKESEIIFSKFVEKFLYQLSEAEILDYAKLIEETDATLLDWLIYGKDVPAHLKDNLVIQYLYKCLK